MQEVRVKVKVRARFIHELHVKGGNVGLRCGDNVETTIGGKRGRSNKICN